LLGTEWESGDAGSLGGASNLILLARLAVDRFSGLDELAEKAIDLCLGWVLQVPASELLSILLAGNQESSSIVGRLVELAREMEDVTLWLGETPIADLSPLSELPKLTGLLLHGTSITDLRPLVGLTALRVLTLDGTTISDLAPLAKLRKLESLSLAEMPVTDLSPLTGLTELRRLYLEGSQVKDLLALADLMKLEMLDLNNTQVADIAPLVGLKKLRRLNLWRTRVSKEQVLSLKRALPDLQIHGPDGGGV
jgi:hypothetical protein